MRNFFQLGEVVHDLRLPSRVCNIRACGDAGGRGSACRANQGMGMEKCMYTKPGVHSIEIESV